MEAGLESVPVRCVARNLTVMVNGRFIFLTAHFANIRIKRFSSSDRCFANLFVNLLASRR
jgi:hypothetical protein